MQSIILICNDPATILSLNERCLKVRDDGGTILIHSANGIRLVLAIEGNSQGPEERIYEAGKLRKIGCELLQPVSMDEAIVQDQAEGQKGYDRE